MRNHCWYILLLLHPWIQLRAQMPVNGDTLYGHEWLRPGVEYIKIKVAKDGIYRLDAKQLASLGMDSQNLIGRNLKLEYFGREIPLFTSQNGLMGESDFILFYGKKNRDELDRFCYQDPNAQMLQPDYSIVTDTSTYYLSIQEGQRLRWEEVQNVEQGLPEPEKFYWAKSEVRFTSTYYKMPNFLGSSSRFKPGDGFAGQLMSHFEATLVAPDKYDGDIPALLQFRGIANNSTNHDLSVLWNQTEIKNYRFNNFQFVKDSALINPGQVHAENRLRFSRQGPVENRYAIAWAELMYPRHPIWPAGNPSMEIDFVGDSLKHIQIRGISGQILCLEKESNQFLLRQSQGDSLVFGYQPIYAKQSWILVPIDQIPSPEEAIKWIYTPYNFAQDISYLIVYHPDLQYYQGRDIIAEYAAYRTSKGEKVDVVDMQGIYDIHGYGIERHFLALRNFFNHLRQTHPNLKHILLCGKGLDLTQIRTSQQLAQFGNQFFIPVFGVPGSDHLLVMRNHALDQAFAIGRIPATTSEEIFTYLEKVRIYENKRTDTEYRRNQKRIIHITGGRNAAEQLQLQTIMRKLQLRLEMGTFAGEFFNFHKNSNDPIQGAAPEQIYRLINSGVGMIGFMGHSGSTTLDFDIDNLSLYQNDVHYPVFIALGCSVGNMYSPIKSLGERFNLSANKGSIIFFSTSGQGYPSTLEHYAGQIYENISESDLTLGQIIQKVNLQNSSTSNRLLQETIEQHTFNGDPALRPTRFEYPDFVLDEESFSILPNVVHVGLDSFQISFDMLNIGRNNQDKVDILGEIIAPDGRRDSIVLEGLALESFRKNIQHSILLGSNSPIGLYRIYLEVNPKESILEGPLPEASLNNKSGPYSIFVSEPGAIPSSPIQLYMHGGDDILLTSAVREPLKPLQSIRLEWSLDPEFIHSTGVNLNAESGQITYSHSLNLRPYKDSSVIFWRTCVLNPGTADTVWRSSSFTYIRGVEEGLGMFHPVQFHLGDTSNLRVDSVGEWRHVPVDRQYLIRNSVFRNSAYPSGFYEGQRINSFFPFVSLLEGVAVVVLDAKTGLRWENPPGGRFGSINNSVNPIVCFPYQTNRLEGRSALMEFLQDSIPLGSTVIMYSVLRTFQSNYGAAEWGLDSMILGKNLFQILEKEGFPEMRNLSDGISLPFVLSYRKGVGPIEFTVATSPTDTIIGSVVVEESLPSGKYSWHTNQMSEVKEIFWASARISSDTTAQLKLTALQNSNPIVQTDQAEGTATLTDSQPYPHMAMYFESENPQRKAFQLKHWGIKGTLQADLAWSMFKIDLAKDTLLQGQPVKLISKIQNLGNNIALHSKYTLQLINSQGEMIFKDSAYIDSLAILTSLDIEKLLDLPLLKGGNYQLVGELESSSPELRLDNNVAAFGFYVQEDKQNPIMDVYFDGRRIVNGDLVSFKPEITFILRDLNPYLRLNNPQLFEIKIKPPGSSDFREINLFSPEVNFEPPQEDGPNEAILWYRPVFDTDGEYTMTVQARDRNGNLASVHPFTLQFKVMKESKISSITNYPNPFSRSTRFVYTMSGADPPDNYSIRIYNISGQLVREIDRSELGPLRVGTHTTDFSWDGRDQYGNLLANGVYLYRLDIKDGNPEAWKHMNTSLDRFSEKGWSKMVILR